MSQGLLVTGAAGFIGYNLCTRLLQQGQAVVGLDNLQGHSDTALPEQRLALLREQPGFSFHRADVADPEAVSQALSRADTAAVVHLAARVGVGASRHQPMAYTHTNVLGMVNMLECCREAGVEHLVYASSSSVYGASSPSPFTEAASAVQPMSLYAATKRSGELLAHSAAHVHAQASTGLRFFTVYGPWGRPDMAVYRFAQALLDGQPLQVFHQGEVQRDFTYVGDVVEAVLRVVQAGPQAATARVLNVGPGAPVDLLHLIAQLEQITGRRALTQMVDGPLEDVPGTWADPMALQEAVGFRPQTPLSEGLTRFVHWLRQQRAQT